MDKVDSLDKINSSVSDIHSLRKGYLSNFFLDRKKYSIQIEKGELFYVSFPDGYLPFHLTDSVNNLLFLTTALQQLVGGPKAVLSILFEQLIVDIVGDGKITSLKDMFVEQGFSVYEQFCRVSRFGASEYKVSDALNVRLVEEADACMVQDTFHTNSDPSPEQLPYYEEILDFIPRKGVLIYKERREVYDFIIFEPNGQTLYLCYRFVLLEYQDLKIGSRLFNEFM